MSDLIKTLHKKGDNTVNVYPNIKSENIPDNAITTAKINDNAITTAKISDASISTNKLQNGVVTTNKILAGAVTYSKLAYGAVTTDRIADGAVTNTEIANGTIEPTKLADRLYTHAIEVHLKDTSANVTFFLGFNIISKSNSSLILQFSDLLDALKPFEQISVWDVGNDKPGYISSVDFQGNGYISAFVDDNGTMTEYEFDEIVADSFDNDKITLLY